MEWNVQNSCLVSLTRTAALAKTNSEIARCLDAVVSAFHLSLSPLAACGLNDVGCRLDVGSELLVLEETLLARKGVFIDSMLFLMVGHWFLLISRYGHFLPFPSQLLPTSFLYAYIVTCSNKPFMLMVNKFFSLKMNRKSEFETTPADYW